MQFPAVRNLRSFEKYRLRLSSSFGSSSCSFCSTSSSKSSLFAAIALVLNRSFKSLSRPVDQFKALAPLLRNAFVYKHERLARFLNAGIFERARSNSNRTCFRFLLLQKSGAYRTISTLLKRNLRNFSSETFRDLQLPAFQSEELLYSYHTIYAQTCYLL